MHRTLQAPAPNLPLSAGMELRLEAIDPTTDAQVAGVVVTRWSIYGDDVSEETQVDAPGVPTLVIPLGD